MGGKGREGKWGRGREAAGGKGKGGWGRGEGRVSVCKSERVYV